MTKIVCSVYFLIAFQKKERKNFFLCCNNDIKGASSEAKCGKLIEWQTNRENAMLAPCEFWICLENLDFYQMQNLYRNPLYSLSVHPISPSIQDKYQQA